MSALLFSLSSCSRTSLRLYYEHYQYALSAVLTSGGAAGEGEWGGEGVGLVDGEIIRYPRQILDILTTTRLP